MKMEQIMAEMKAIMKAGYEEMKYHQERMMVIIKTGLEEMKSVAVHEVIPKEEAAVKPVRSLKRQHRGRHLATGHRGKLKEQAQGNDGSRKKFAAARRGMTCCAEVAWCKGCRCSHKGSTVGQRQRKKCTRDNVVQGTRKGQTFGRRCRAQLECNNGIRD
jgi:hypothetical protein